MKFELEVEQVIHEMRLNMQAQAQAQAGSETTPDLHLLSQLESHLTVTERTWSRLPPLMSNRQGRVARLELWLKRQVKRAMWWFVWEQVNFNAATNDALHTLLAALAQQKKQELDLRLQIDELKAGLQSLRDSLPAKADATRALTSKRRDEEPAGR